MKLLKSTATVGGATIASRIVGFVRDVVLARMFGASGATDAFFLAFRIPNLMRRLFAEGSFSLAFVPVLSEYWAAGDRHAQACGNSGREDEQREAVEGGGHHDVGEMQSCDALSWSASGAGGRGHRPRRRSDAQKHFLATPDPAALRA